MNARQKSRLARIIIAAALFAAAYAVFATVDVPEKLWYIELSVYIAIYLVAAYDVIVKAARGIFGGQVFDENFLMTVATVGAFCVREYPEAAAVMLFYQVGELFQSIAVGKSRKSISSLMDIRPDTATVIRNGERLTVSPDEVEVGEVMEVRAGEKIALDGIVSRGSGMLNTAALTGESAPVFVKEGDEVKSGSINTNSVMEITATKPFSESTASKILDLVENASSKKAKAENFITRFAKFYTPAVVGFAVILAVVPSIITGEWQEWVHRALMFLVVSCPCALVISVPLAFFGGIGAASARGVLVKGGNYLELLARLDTVVFDKTGTLTYGKFSVTHVVPESEREHILNAAALAESGSNHPVAQSVLAAAKAEGIAEVSGASIREIAGKGVEATRGNTVVLAGNAELMREFCVEYVPCELFGTHVYVAENGKFLGTVVISDTVKEDAKSVIDSFRRDNVRTVMLTGDNERAAKAVAEQTGVGEYAASLLPADKVEKLETIIAGKSKKSVVAFVGDGINDAPVLSRADVGIAMGALGSDSAIEAADVVLMHDNLGSIAKAKEVAKKTMRIAFENIVFALLVKAVVLVLSALGITSMWLAIFADVGVTVIAVLNSVRIIAFGSERGKCKKRQKNEK